MKKKDLYYDLPERLIAVKPSKVSRRDRIMLLNREKQITEDHYFDEFASFFEKGDLLVFNNTKVIKARILGKSKTHDRECEVLLLESTDALHWNCFIKNAKRFHIDEELVFGPYTAKIESIEAADGSRNIVFDNIIGTEFLDNFGEMPLPPYIRKRRKDLDLPLYQKEDDVWYQSMYAKENGSVAAPTASLHFNKETEKALLDKGVNIDFITLHVGAGTFKPIDTEDTDDFDIHHEWMSVSQDVVDKIKKTKAEGHRVIAIGTTVMRTLETAGKDGEIKPFEGMTNLYIKPPFTFHVVDGILTNFHMPESSLLLLVYAFAGQEFINRAYQEAIQKEYFFFSYGDATLII